MRTTKPSFFAAKFTCKCAETGNTIKRGERIYFDWASRKPYCCESTMYRDNLRSQAEADFDELLYKANNKEFFDNYNY